MRLIAFGVAVLLALLAAGVAASTVFRPPPAATRLAGVSVTVAGYTIEDLGDKRHRLHLSVAVASIRDSDECIGFTLDEPFAGRRLDAASGGCVRPRAGSETVALLFERLSEDDLRFPSHTLVWGIPGGRCGPIFELVGVCVVEQAWNGGLRAAIALGPAVVPPWIVPAALLVSGALIPPRAQVCRGSQRTGRDRGLRKITPRGDVAAESSRTAGHSSSTASSAACASMRARWIPTHAWGPWAKARCDLELGRERSNTSGSGNVAGSRFAAVSETMTRSPRSI
jgi:hypothetical protein